MHLLSIIGWAKFVTRLLLLLPCRVGRILRFAFEAPVSGRR